MPAILLSGPAVEPITLADAKAYLRVEHSDDDLVIAAFIAAARIHVETQTRRALITQTWRIVRDAWPCDGKLSVSPSPLQAVTAARVYESDGSTLSIDTQAFVADKAAAPAIVAFAAWSLPVPGRGVGGIEIDVRVGYGDAGVNVPEPSGTAVLTFDTVLGKYVVKGLKLTSSVSGQHGLYALNGSIVDLQNVDFGALNGGWHMLGAQGGQINTVGNYKISGGAAYHVVASQSGSVSGQSITVTLTGTPAFTSAFARATRSGTTKSAAITYSGAATGPRYFAEANGVVYTAGGGASYFPGDSAGSVTTGGQYV
jgi:uncharacterized phiE125 gp8 family phage protein